MQRIVTGIILFVASLGTGSVLGQERSLGFVTDKTPPPIAVPHGEAEAKRIVEAYWNKELGEGEPRPKITQIMDYGPAKQFSVYNDHDPGFKFWTNQAFPSATDVFVAAKVQFPSKQPETQAYFIDRTGANVQVFSKYKRLSK